MLIARTEITDRARISIPAGVLKKLDIGPGSTLEWLDDNGKIIVRRAGGFSFIDIHQALFPKGPKLQRLTDIKAGIRQYVRTRHSPR